MSCGNSGTVLIEVSAGFIASRIKRMAPKEALQTALLALFGSISGDHWLRCTS
jgi:hypothetical protein